MNKIEKETTRQGSLFIITNSKLEVARHNTGFLVITSGIASQLKDLSSEVFKDSSKIN